MPTKKTALPSDLQVKYICQLTYYIDSAWRARKKLGDQGIRNIIDFLMARHPDCVYSGDAVRLTKFSDDKALTFLVTGKTTLNKFSFYSFTTDMDLLYKASSGGLFPRDDFADHKLNNVVFTSKVTGLDVYKVLRKPEVLLKQLEFLLALKDNEILSNVSGFDNFMSRIDKVIKEVKGMQELTEKYVQMYPQVNFFISLAFKWAAETHDTHTLEQEILVPSPVSITLENITKKGGLNFLPSPRTIQRLQVDHDILGAWLSTFPKLEPTVLSALKDTMELVDVQIERPDHQVIQVHLRWTAKDYDPKNSVVRIIQRDFGNPANKGTDILTGTITKGSHEAKAVQEYIKETKQHVQLKNTVKTVTR